MRELRLSQLLLLRKLLGGQIAMFSQLPSQQPRIETTADQDTDQSAEGNQSSSNDCSQGRGEGRKVHRSQHSRSSFLSCLSQSIARRPSGNQTLRVRLGPTRSTTTRCQDLRICVLETQGVDRVSRSPKCTVAETITGLHITGDRHGAGTTNHVDGEGPSPDRNEEKGRSATESSSAHLLHRIIDGIHCDRAEQSRSPLCTGMLNGGDQLVGGSRFSVRYTVGRDTVNSSAKSAMV